MMNILLVSQMDLRSTTGVATYYRALKLELEAAGHYAEVITPEHTPKWVSFLLKLVRRSRIVFRSDYAALYISELVYFVSVYFAVRKVRKKKAWDVIHGQDPSSSCAARYAVRGKIPVLTTCHYNDTPVEERRLKYKLSVKQLDKVTNWFRFLFSRLDSLIFVSEYIHDKSVYLLPQGVKYQVIPNGVRFYGKTELIGKPECFTIVNTGTLEDRKNQVLLIEAAVHLKAKGQPFRISFLGEGPARNRLEQTVKEKGLQDHIEFKGHVSGILDLYRKADLYVHTSLNESWGLCVTEAFSVGLPVLALANGGIPEQFPPSRDGLLNPSTNAEELAAQIEICYNFDIRKQLQEAQYAYASARFSSDHMLKETMKCYQEMAIKS